MKVLNVVPKVGQVWVNNESHVEVKITGFGCKSVTWDAVSGCHSGTAFDDTIYTRFTFVPANSLEFTAVNVEFWDPKYVDSINGHTYGKWLAKRNELYGAEEIAEDKSVNKVNMITDYAKLPAKVEIDINADYYTKEGEGKYTLIETIADLRRYRHRLFSKVERPITWQEAVRDFISNDMEQPFTDIGTDNGCIVFPEIGFTDEQFIEMCHLVTSLTKGE